jgi:GNAT superfamily N-acetyltransferase
MPETPAFHCRFATRDDLDALVALLGILFAQERELHPDPVRQRTGLSRILADPARGRIFVAEETATGTVVATCALLASESTFLGGPVAWLEDVCVLPDRRGHGIGRALLEHALAWARASGLARVTLLTDHDNVTAQALYASLGFTRSSMTAMRVVFGEE